MSTNTTTAEPMGGTYRSALAHRDFRLLFIGESVSNTGSWAYSVALVVFVFQATHSPGWVGALALGRFVPALLFSPYAGVLAERYERRRLLVRLDAAMFVVMATLGLVMVADGPPLLAVVLSGVNTLLGCVYRPAVESMIPRLVGERDLAAANSLSGVVDNLAIIAGPGAGAALLAATGPSVTVFINAATFAVAGFFQWRIRTRVEATDVTEGGSAGFLQQCLVGARTIWSDTNTAVLVAFSVFASFIFGTDTVLFVLMSERRLGTGSEGYGYLLVALGVGGLLGAAAVNRISVRAPLSAALAGGLILYALPIAAMPAVHSPVVAFLIVVARGFGTLVVDVLAVSAMQRMLPADRLARVLGVFYSLVVGAITLGSLLTPLLLRATSLDITQYAYGLGITAGVLAVYPRLRSMDRSSRARGDELEPVIAELHALGLFAAASRPVLERLATTATEEHVPAGRSIISEGEPADALYVLRTGSVDVFATGTAGTERHIRTMRPGSYFGEIGLIQRVPRTATVRATEDCTVLRIDGEAFLEALRDGQASRLFVAMASGRLRTTHPTSTIDLDA